MSEIKALEKLRNAITTYAAECDERWLLASCDDVEAEITERYMLLPVDADGVPIHVGDICEMNGERFEVRQLTTDGDYWWAVDRLGEFYIAELCRHVKSRTLEDVLIDAMQFGFSSHAGDDVSEKAREFADD